MKRPGDMKRRRHAAHRRGHRDALDMVLVEIERLARNKLIDAAVLRELREVCHRPPPDLDEPDVVQRRA